MAGDFEALKIFVDNKLNIQGIWSSPGGEKKLFQSEFVNIHWWKNKKFLMVEGKQAKRINRLLYNLLAGDLLDDQRCVTDRRHDSCKCSEVSSDVEGVKLDIAILEAKFNQQSDLLSQLQKEVAKRGPSSVEKQSKPAVEMHCNNSSAPTQLTNQISEKPAYNDADGVVITLVKKYVGGRKYC